MVFSDPTFLFFFLPFCLAMYWLINWRWRNALFVISGLLFYIAGAEDLVLLLLATVTVNYSLARKIRSTNEGSKLPKFYLISGIVFNVGTLGFWKYGGLFASLTTDISNLLGLRANFSLSLVLPIAISFYTFQCVSFLIDVYRGEIQTFPSYKDFCAYILFFPQLIAGPIVRYRDVEEELHSRTISRFEDIYYGAPRFFWGLAKKVLIADQISVIADRAFDLPDNRLTILAAWIGIFAYALQIYFDFSGYSDMAIGLARMFGIRFHENFNNPYRATSLTDFWRRWHISLSTWFRDYVYIPLGGNRSPSKFRTYFNLYVVFMLTGLWHGSNWTFLFWGLFHGLILTIERIAREREFQFIRFAFFQRLLTFLIVCLGWVIFRADSMNQAVNYLSALLWPGTWDIPLTVQEVLTSQRIFWMLVGATVLFLPQRVHIGSLLSHRQSMSSQLVRVASVFVLTPLTGVYVLTSSFSPFLYFQF